MFSNTPANGYCQTKAEKVPLNISFLLGSLVLELLVYSWKKHTKKPKPLSLIPLTHGTRMFLYLINTTSSSSSPPCVCPLPSFGPLPLFLFPHPSSLFFSFFLPLTLPPPRPPLWIFPILPTPFILAMGLPSSLGPALASVKHHPFVHRSHHVLISTPGAKPKNSRSPTPPDSQYLREVPGFCLKK